MNEIDTILKKTYFETVFDPPEMSQNEDRQLDSLIFQLSPFSEPLPEKRALCFLDHLVMVTRSSTGTSLISILEKGKLLNSERGKEDGVEADKEGLKLGEEHELPSGLIWVAMSLLERAGDTLVPASLKPSNFSPIIWNQHKKLHIISTKVYSFKIT